MLPVHRGQSGLHAPNQLLRAPKVTLDRRPLVGGARAAERLVVRLSVHGLQTTQPAIVCQRTPGAVLFGAVSERA